MPKVYYDQTEVNALHLEIAELRSQVREYRIMVGIRDTDIDTLRTENDELRNLFQQQQEAWGAHTAALRTENNELRAEIKELRLINMINREYGR